MLRAGQRSPPDERRAAHRRPATRRRAPCDYQPRPGHRAQHNHRSPRGLGASLVLAPAQVQ